MTLGQRVTKVREAECEGKSPFQTASITDFVYTCPISDLNLET